jgi:hypothetical protein
LVPQGIYKYRQVIITTLEYKLLPFATHRGRYCCPRGVLVFFSDNLFYNRYTKSERRSQINKAEQVKENYKEEEE